MDKKQAKSKEKKTISVNESIQKLQDALELAKSEGNRIQIKAIESCIKRIKKK